MVEQIVNNKIAEIIFFRTGEYLINRNLIGKIELIKYLWIKLFNKFKSKNFNG
jgi:hypothetical protein